MTPRAVSISNKMLTLSIKELLAILTRVSLIFPLTYQVALRNIALAKDVINCSRKASPRILEVLFTVFILISFE
jgi:hypothetical protein